MLQMDLGHDGKLYIKLEPQLRLQLCSEFSKVVTAYDKMAKWFNDPKVPQQQKDKFNDVHTKALAEMNFLYQLLRRCGLSDEEIKECANIPF